MFSEFLSRLTQAPVKPLKPNEAQLAVAALLVRLAKSDQHYAFEEIAQIDAILAERYLLTPVQAAQLRAEGEKIADTAPCADAFAEQVKAAVPYEDRSAVVVAMWKVLIADGVEHPAEEALMTLASQSFGIDTSDLLTALRPRLS